MAACSTIWCFRRCRSLVGGGLSTGHVRLEELPTVKLDTSHMGQDVVIVKNGRRICGTGGALANAPIVQDKGYFEIKLQSTGVWGVGLATRKCSLHAVPLGIDINSWVLRNDGVLCHNGEEKAKLSEMPQEGDIIGITYNHIEMKFYLNGTLLSTTMTGIRGEIYPVFYVDEGAIIDVHFTGFYHTPPSGYEEIMIEKSLL